MLHPAKKKAIQVNILFAKNSKKSAFLRDNLTIF